MVRCQKLEVEIITAPAIVEDGEGEPILTIKVEKKPWNKMNAKERKEHQATKAKEKAKKDKK